MCYNYLSIFCAASAQSITLRKEGSEGVLGRPESPREYDAQRPTARKSVDLLHLASGGTIVSRETFFCFTAEPDKEKAYG